MVQHFIENHADAPTLALFTVKCFDIGLRSHIRRRANVEDSADLCRVDDLAEPEVNDDRVELLIYDDV